MLLFCPTCSNILTITRDPNIPSANSSASGENGTHRFECRTCPYQYHLAPRHPFYERKKFKLKEPPQALGAGDEGRVQIDISCTNDKCEGQRAFFHEKQIRSADEPMTEFYECMTCRHRWQVN